MDIQPTYVAIKQRTEDGEAKRFVYNWQDIIGRIEINEMPE